MLIIRPKHRAVSVCPQRYWSLRSLRFFCLSTYTRAKKRGEKCPHDALPGSQLCIKHLKTKVRTCEVNIVCFCFTEKKKIPHPNNLKGFSHISCAPDTSASSSTCDGVPLDCSGYLVALLALCYSNKLRAQEWFSSTAPSSRSWPSRCNLSQGSLFFYLFSSICLIF